MSRRTSTVVTANRNPAPPAREEVEDHEAVNSSSSWSLYVSIAFIVLSLGGGGIAALLSLLGAQLPAGTQYAVIVLTSLSAVALSGFIIKGLGEIKVEGKKLLDKIGPVGSDARRKAENDFGSGLRAYRLAQGGQASAVLAVVSNGAMLATTVARTQADHAELLPLAWSVTNVLLTSGSNLAGFVLFTSLGARNGRLLSEVHKVELNITNKKIIGLEKRLREAGLAPDAVEPAAAVATDLFHSRPSAQAVSVDAAQQRIDASAAETEGGAAAVPTVSATGH